MFIKQTKTLHQLLFSFQDLVMQTPEGLAEEESLEEGINMIELASKGGWVMIVLLIFSIIAVGVFFSKLFELSKANKNPEKMLGQIKSMVTHGKVDSARDLASQENTPISRLLVSGINHLGLTIGAIENAIESRAKLELHRLEKNLNLLAVIYAAAPMLGFLGTVVGMIQAFMALSQNSGGQMNAGLTTGIYEAMVTTAAGLIVGLLSYLLYSYLVSKIESIVYKMQLTSTEFIELLQTKVD
jgi:biopolymer transport protein ExbB